MMLLQSFGYLIRSGTIGGSLHHTHHFGFGFQFTAIIIQIGNHRTKIHLQYRFVNLSLQNLRQRIETKLTRALNQDYFILQRQFTFSNGINQRSRIRIKSFLDIKSWGTWGDFISHTNNTFYSPAVHQLCHLAIKSRSILPGFQYIRKNKCPLQSLALWATIQKIERYVQRTEIRIITIVYQQATIFTLFHFQTHCHRLQFCHTLRYLPGRKHQIQAGCQTVQRVLDRSIIYERQCKCVVHIQITIGNYGRVLLLFHLVDIQGALHISPAPCYFAGRKDGFTYTITDKLVITIINHDITILKKRQFFHALLLQREKILLMCAAYIG